MIRMHELLHDLKSNLVLEHDEDDLMLRGYLTAAIDYAESYQHREPEYYDVHAMSASTRQAVLLLASHFTNRATAARRASSETASRRVGTCGKR